MADGGMRDFCNWLHDVEDGKLRDDLSDAVAKTLEELHEQAKATSCAKKGGLTLKLEFTVEGNGAVHVHSAMETKTPKPTRQADHFYIAKDGGMTRRNPRQQEMKFKEVSAPRLKEGTDQ